MNETTGLSLAQQAHEHASYVVNEQSMVEPAVAPVDTVSDMLELAESARETRNILALRYQEIHPAPEAMSPEHKERVAHHIRFLKEVGKITTREWDAIGLSEDSRDIPDDVTKAVSALESSERGYVASLTRPDWESYFPEHKKQITLEDIQKLDTFHDRTDDEIQDALASFNEAEDGPEKYWEAFKRQYPEDMQFLLEDLHQTTKQLKLAHEDPSLLEAFGHENNKRFDVLAAASAARSLTRSAEKLHEKARRMRLSLPDGTHNKALLARANQLDKDAKVYETEAGRFVQTEAVKHELRRRSLLDDRRNLRNGLLYTPEMQDVVDSFVPQLLAGKPVLLVGETGGAKTAAAEEMARRVNKQLGRKDLDQYEFVSGYGQMNSYQLMGKDTIKDGSVEFTYGAITRSMREGKPLIIDEGNAMDADIIKRLNKVLQLKPGDVFQIQEDGGERVQVQKGFCVIMTANEKSTRYKGVNELSSDFKNRFGANVARVTYPDQDVLPGQVPTTLIRLAYASLVDHYGNLPQDNPAVNETEILKFVRACHHLQLMFCKSTAELPVGFVADPEATTRGASGQTVLKMETISPRLMTGILEDIRLGGRSGVTLQKILNRYVNGITEASDRKHITRVLSAQGLL